MTDTITIRLVNEAELDADSADLSVTIEGTALFSGAEAFKKAKELQTLVAALKDVGVEQDRVKLRSVELNSQSFLIKSSSVRYVISIKRVSVERLPDVLSALAAHKGAKLTKLKWNYLQLKPTRQRLRREALAEALEQARLDAEVLGVKLLGVHEVVEEVRDLGYNPEYVYGDGNESVEAIQAIRRFASSPSAPALGNSTMASITLKVTFRVTPLTAES